MASAPSDAGWPRPELPVEMDPNPVIQAWVFEGMFLKALPADAAFKAELKAIGYDADAPLPEYPLALYARCCKVASRRFLPEMEEREAQRELGRRYIDGVLNTFIGKVIAVPMRFGGPVRMLDRLPRYVEMSGTHMKVRTTRTSQRTTQIDIHFHPDADQSFTHGFLEGVMKAVGVDATVARIGGEGNDGVFLVSW